MRNTRIRKEIREIEREGSRGKERKGREERGMKEEKEIREIEREGSRGKERKGREERGMKEEGDLRIQYSTTFHTCMYVGHPGIPT